jgi:hypothetical protein
MAPVLPRDLLQAIDCETAEKFLEELTPHTGQTLWNRIDAGGWMFRGQGEAVWGLTPSARRKDALLPFLPAQRTMPSYSETELAQIEAGLVAQFASLVSDFGFEVPGDSGALRDPEQPSTELNFDFPPVDQRAMYVLAQHYGVPTRLLDWTRRPNFGAYFAARDAADPDRGKPPNSDGRLAVWAVQEGFINTHCRRWHPGAVVVTAPTVSNPNLHAQMGRLTLVRWAGSMREADVPLPDLDELFRREANVDSARAAEGADSVPLLPMMVKLTLPRAEAPRVMYHLNVQGVNVASVFPGRDSIVKYMLEERLRPVPPRG